MTRAFISIVLLMFLAVFVESFEDNGTSDDFELMLKSHYGSVDDDVSSTRRHSKRSAVEATDVNTSRRSGDMRHNRRGKRSLVVYTNMGDDLRLNNSIITHAEGTRLVITCQNLGRKPHWYQDGIKVEEGKRLHSVLYRVDYVIDSLSSDHAGLKLTCKEEGTTKNTTVTIQVLDGNGRVQGTSSTSTIPTKITSTTTVPTKKKIPKTTTTVPTEKKIPTTTTAVPRKSTATTTIPVPTTTTMPTSTVAAQMNLTDPKYKTTEKASIKTNPTSESPSLLVLVLVVNAGFFAVILIILLILCCMYRRIFRRFSSPTAEEVQNADECVGQTMLEQNIWKPSGNDVENHSYYYPILNIQAGQNNGEPNHYQSVENVQLENHSYYYPNLINFR